MVFARKDWGFECTWGYAKISLGLMHNIIKQITQLFLSLGECDRHQCWFHTLKQGFLDPGSYPMGKGLFNFKTTSFKAIFLYLNFKKHHLKKKNKKNNNNIFSGEWTVCVVLFQPKPKPQPQTQLSSLGQLIPLTELIRPIMPNKKLVRLEVMASAVFVFHRAENYR